MGTSPSVRAEHHLIRRCVAGDQRARSNLAQAYQEPLLRIVHAVLHRRGFTWELADEAVGQMWCWLLDHHCRPLLDCQSAQLRLLGFLAGRALDQAHLILRRRQRRNWEVFRPFNGQEQILAVSGETSIESMIADLRTSLTEEQAVFMQDQLLQAHSGHITNRGPAFRQMKHQVLVKSQALASGVGKSS